MDDRYVNTRSIPYKRLNAIKHKTPSLLRISLRGVPHLVTYDGQCSVCYFGTLDVYRVWEGYNAVETVVGTYPDPNYVIDYLNDFHPVK